MGDQLGERLLQAASAVERQLDEQLHKMDRLDDDELERIKQKRLQQIKKQQQQKQDWLAAGHGQYTELADEREFFDACKKSSKMVCHFYRDDEQRCKVMDKHLNVVAHKYLNVRFVKINSEKFPFLTKRLNVRVAPTLCIIVDSNTVDYIRGFNDLGDGDDFKTEALETRLAKSGVVNYTGDAASAALAKEATKSILGRPAKNIRGMENDSSDSE